MRKIISLALAVLMIATMSVTAFAQEITGNSGSTVVTHTADESYVVTIPDSMSVGTDATVSVSNVTIASNKQLTVSVSSTQYNNGWKLKNGDDTIGYTLKMDNADVANDGTVLTAKSGETATKTLKTALTGTAKYSGTYTDTLTFTVGVASASNGTTEAQTTVTDEDGLKAALQAGGKIQLGAGIELTETIETQVISADLDITLDLNGYSITDAADFSSYNLLVFGNETDKTLKLTIRDSSAGKTGKIESDCTALAFSYGAEDGSSEITLESGIISGKNALTLNGEAKASINGGTLVGGSDSEKGAALLLSGRYASAVINGGTVYNDGIGYSIYLQSADNRLEIKDGEIRTAIKVESTDMPTITVTGGLFTFDPSQYVDTDHYKVIGSPVSNPTMWMVTAKDD